MSRVIYLISTLDKVSDVSASFLLLSIAALFLEDGYIWILLAP